MTGEAPCPVQVFVPPEIKTTGMVGSPGLIVPVKVLDAANDVLTPTIRQRATSADMSSVFLSIMLSSKYAFVSIKSAYKPYLTSPKKP